MLNTERVTKRATLEISEIWHFPKISRKVRKNSSEQKYVEFWRRRRRGVGEGEQRSQTGLKTITWGFTAEGTETLQLKSGEKKKQKKKNVAWLKCSTANVGTKGNVNGFVYLFILIELEIPPP